MIDAKLILLYLLQSTDVSSLGVDPKTINYDEAYCMAQNIYYEAKSEDVRGQYAVAHATLNRVNDPRFPKTVCEVVKQVGKTPSGKKACAFSWYCDGKSDEVPVRKQNGEPNKVVEKQFETASKIAILTLSGKSEDNTNGATHFHNPYISKPQWIHNLTRTLRIGNHDFYKMRKRF
jgi:spore germination cell wall hydrolase CwlJ-like protein